jgi:hypothetical protein
MLGLFVFCVASFRNPEVTTLTDQNFGRLVDQRSPRTIWMVMLRGPNCQACDQIWPTFVSVAEKMNGIVLFGLIDCVSETRVCGRFKIRTIPRFYIFDEKGWTDAGMFMRFEARFMKVLMSHIPDYVKRASKKWVRDNPKAAILFTKKRRVPDFWKALAANLSDYSVKYGFAHDRPTMSRFNVTNDKILFLDKGRTKDYAGEMAFHEVRQALFDYYGLELPGKRTDL